MAFKKAFTDYTLTTSYDTAEVPPTFPPYLDYPFGTHDVEGDERLASDWTLIKDHGGSKNDPKLGIKKDGTLWTWGYNDQGQLGDNTVIGKESSPVQTICGGNDWVQGSVGNTFCMAIKTDGTLWGWGENNRGQLGDGFAVSRSSPVQIGTETTWSKISCYDRTSAALKTDGTLWTWGRNTQAQLGQGYTAADKSSPVQVGSETTWTDVCMGDDNAIAVKGGELWIWGSADTWGQIGIIYSGSPSSPVQVITGDTWESVSFGTENAAALKTDGSVWAWGDNDSGQLGYANWTVNQNSSSPIQIADGTGWKKVHAGNNQIVMIDSNDNLYAMGSKLIGSGNDASSPVQITSSKYHDALTNADEEFWAIRKDTSGVQSFEDRYVKKSVLETEGNLWMCGYNATEQLGDLSAVNKSSPVQTSTGGNNWTKLGNGAGTDHSASIKVDGSLWLWGDNSAGQLGINVTGGANQQVYSPVQTVCEGTNWSELSIGYRHSAAIKTDGTLWIWGDNSQGQLGESQATTVDRSSPVQTVAGGNDWSQISCGYDFTASIKTDGTLWTWGRGDSGQLGNQGATDRSSPVQTISGGNDWYRVACGDAHTGAIKTDGSLWLWGYNAGGNLADETTASKSSPVQTVAGGNNWKKISCGYASVASIKTDGTLWMWGLNFGGQLGTNETTTAGKSSPVQTVAGGKNWREVSIGVPSSSQRAGALGSSVSAIKTDGTLWVWGNGDQGQLGTDNVIGASSPVQTVVGGNDWTSTVMNGYTFMGIKD